VPPHKHFHKGHWHSRGYLPHFDAPGHLQSLVFRLANSLPREILVRLLDVIPERLQAERRAAVEDLLDKGHGPCWLCQPEIADIVEGALLHFDGTRYRSLAWCIMPNHVHWLIELLPGHSMPGVVKSIKSHSARHANLLLGQEGAFWDREYFDRTIRDTDHLRNVVEYIHQNPVKAGLIRRQEDWRWSSAWSGRVGNLPL
jgi:REP element-mobilizing transposase RayT